MISILHARTRPTLLALVIASLLAACSPEGASDVLDSTAPEKTQPKTEDPSTESASNGVPTSTEASIPEVRSGTIDGVLSYLPDPKSSWRQARYYVKSSKGGPLAEAVVALRGPLAGVRRQSPEPRTVTVDQENFLFTPETVAIQVGDAVRFTNGDSSIHNVHSTEGDAFNVSLLQGKEYVHTFRRPTGADAPVLIGCVFHGGMRAWIYVFDHPFHVVTGEDGRFHFEGVPPGEYTIDVVHPAGELRKSTTVKVEPGGTTAVEIQVSPGDVPSR